MKLVITVSRRFGTGATSIAQELSTRLGIPFYDSSYIEQEMASRDYENEEELILSLAQNPCIILGRYAAYVLRNQMNSFNIYVSARKEDRIHRIMDLESLSYEEAKDKVDTNDQIRADFYYENTGKTWGDINDYHMVLDASELGLENCADIVIRYFEKMEYI